MRQETPAHTDRAVPPGNRRRPWTSRLAFKLIVSLTLIVAIVAGISQVINSRTQEQQLLDEVILAADQLSRSITSATWEAMLLDQRGAAYKVMKTIALKQGINRIRIFNRDGGLMFSTAPNEKTQLDKSAEALHPLPPLGAPARETGREEPRPRVPGRGRPAHAGHDHAHLQRAGLQPGGLPRPPGRRQRAGGPRHRHGPQPGGHRNGRHPPADPADDLPGDRPHRDLHRLLHPTLRRQADRAGSSKAPRPSAPCSWTSPSRSEAARS